MSDETTEALPEFARDTIVGVLCSLALADHLGDVRWAEEDLWKLLGVDKLDYYHPANSRTRPAGTMPGPRSSP